MTSSDDVYDGAEILLLRVYLSFVLYVMNIPIALGLAKHAWSKINFKVP